MILMVSQASYASCTLARRAIHILVSSLHENHHFISRELFFVPVFISCHTHLNSSRITPTYLKAC
ncbi:hypothetical protein HanRHA438_Chr11g0518901 [Helianthus annuus]|nr:hypothetical protein HanRHA438_Chr11g0518901 [Helianthus annuus]